MPSKLQFYAQMADQTAQQLTGSLQAWTGFLTTAARLYKYPYHEQLMIYAQRPEATACADYDLWNKTMRRYVRRGSQGIALIDTSGDNPKLKYVFDVSDTGGGEQSRRPYLWEYRDEHYDAVTAALERRFEVSADSGLADQLEIIAAQLVDEYWQDNQYDILGIVDGSFLSEYDDFNIGAAFRNAAVVSTTYALLSRCGLEPEEYFTHEDFLNVFDFNTPATVAALGTAISQTSEQVLRQIEVTIKNYEREKLTERTESYDRADVSEERRLPDPQPDADRTEADAAGQVREDAEEVPAGASPGAVESDDPEREPVPAPAGDRRSGEQPSGADDPGAGESGGRDGGAESQRPADLDGADEQLQGPSGGNDSGRAGVRVIDDQPPIVAAEQISLFPSEAEQIESIAEAESAPIAPFASSLPQEDIDQLLLVGSNTEDARTKIALEFMKQRSMPALTAFVKQTYHDGYGLQTGSGSISSWAGEDGLHITRGTSVRYARTAQVLSWEDAAARIGELLEQGRFATNVELTEAPGFERRQVAQSLWYLCHDMSDAARDEGWLPTLRENRQGSFPDDVARLEELLEDPEGRQTIIDQLTLFTQAWREDASLMRFRHYRPDVMLERVAELGIARREYPEGMMELPVARSFITEDEIDANLSRGGSFEGGAGRIYSFWQQEHTPKEKADFLKNEYGTGGGNGAISHNFHSWEEHSAKGIVLRKPDAEEVSLSWAKVAKRIDALVAKDRYLTPEGKAAWEKAQAEAREISNAANDYNAIKEAHPDDLVLFQVGDFFELFGEDARTAANLLDLQLTTRNIPDMGRVAMCGVPANRLEEYLDKIRDTQDAVVASIGTLDGKRVIREVPSIDHEAARAIDAHEAEFGADGYRAFPGDRPEAAVPPPKREITQADIDRAIQAWNGNIQSKQAVVRHMEMHGREKQTAEWLAMEYNARADQPFHISVDGAETDLSWPKVQRRIAQLIKAEKFYTQEEYDNFDDIDPVAVREALAQRGIVNGVRVDESALDNDPFIQQVMADVDRIAQEEQGEIFTSPGGVTYQAGTDVDTCAADGTMVRMHVDRVEDGYVWYTFPDMPEQEPVNVFQSRFEGWLDDGSSALVGTEQPAAPPVFSTPGGKQYRIGEDYEARTTDGEIIVNVHIEDVTEDAVFYSVPEAPDMAQIQLPRGNFDKLMDDGRFTPVQPEAELSPEPEHDLPSPDQPPVEAGPTNEGSPDMPSNAEPPVVKKHTGRTRVERNYRAFAEQFPEIVSGEYRYLALESGVEGSGYMPLIIERIDVDVISVAHTYVQNGDLMYDPEMTFRIDPENRTLEPLTFRQDGFPQIYQEVYPEPGMWIPKLRNDLSAFTDQWLKNIEMQGRIRTRAIAVRDGEDVEIAFDESGNPITEPSAPTAEGMIPGVTTFFYNDREYRIDSIDPETGTVSYLPADASPEDGPITEPISVVRWYLEAGTAPVLEQDGQAAADPLDFTPYKVGDTVYLEDTAYEITAIGDFDVQLRDPTQTYPIFRSEPTQRFEAMLQGDPRNGPITEFLAAELNITDSDLQDVLVGDGGLLELRDKELIAGWFRAGEGNTRIAQRLAATYAGTAETMMLETGETADYFASTTGMEINVLDKYDTKLGFSWAEIVPILRAMYQQERDGFLREPTDAEPTHREETTAFYPGDRNGLPFDVEIRTLHFDEPEHDPPAPTPPPAAENFRITDDHLGEGGPKAKYRMNVDAIRALKQIETEGRSATAAEQEILSRYVGWGGIPDAFDPDKAAWSAEYSELKELLTAEEYSSARASTLNAHYTSPAVIKAVYEAVGNMGFQTGNILEPSMGVGNFFGMLPEEMQNSRLYGVELDSITGRIAQQLYPKAHIAVRGYEKTGFPKDFFDLAVGNVPFGQYQVNDQEYNKLGFSIHNYFFAKALDQVRPGGVVAFVTSRYTMDAKAPTVRKYLAQRADLLGAIRLPNNAFKANAGTDVVSDIIFLQKRDRPNVGEPEWVNLGENEDGFSINQYFLDHPEMVLGVPTSESTQYGRQDYTVAPIPGANLSNQLHEAVSHITGQITEVELPELTEGEAEVESIPADPAVQNSYTVVDGQVYYRENSIMVRPDLNATTAERVKGMVELRDCVRHLMDLQTQDSDDATIQKEQRRLNTLYDDYTKKYGIINSRGNQLAFSADNAYYLLCSLEVLDNDGNMERKADMFTKRTIKPHTPVTHVDTATEALAVSISEKAKVDMEYMTALSGKSEDELFENLKGVIFLNPMHRYSGGVEPKYLTADEYLSGNIREKLRWARNAAASNPEEGYAFNMDALEKALPKDLDASEIDVRLGATWIDKQYIQEFMYELFKTPLNLQREIRVNFSDFTAEWGITGKTKVSGVDVAAYITYGTDRANAYRILEDTLNLRDVRIYDTVQEPDGKERRVLNQKETTLAQQKQQAIKDAFRDWIWRDPERRHALVRKYNDLYNSNRPREYDGQHISFVGMNPEIELREHQRNAIAHVMYGGNTLLAHEVGAGKTFEMVASAMESKRLGLCQKSLFAVPNHLIEQWASEFLRLYPSANILVATKKDFESANRKKFCSRIATGDYDAIIMGHSQFERLPVSYARREHLLQEQILEIEQGLEELRDSGAEDYSIKQLERTKRSLEARLEKLHNAKKDDVVTFEQLGVDRLFIDEAHSYKNLFLYTKMRNVAGLSTSDAQKSSDMLLKCRYMDEITDGKGVVFATGTPVSNSMTELYTMQRYLQHDLLQQKNLTHFDNWASIFGETVTAIELAPEGTGYRARTRFARFFNLPELMAMFKETADIKTSDQLGLPTPEVEYHVEKAQPSEIQKELVQQLSERARVVHTGRVNPKIDNMLKITNDGRKLGLDQRLINPNFPDNPDSKVNMCVDNIVRIWQEGQADKLTQLVFCDLSTPKGSAAAKREKTAKAAGNKTAGGTELHALDNLLKDVEPDTPFSVYEDIRDKLIAKGIPAGEIAFIHDANTDTRKKELFAKVRSGKVRVLIGSTFKMGAGMNVQDRLIALHDLDCPWRPGDLEQRKGRIVRQGNQNEKVHVYRYVTEGTFDSYLWQTVENKQKFISQIMTSKSPVRSCEDVDETALSYAEIKALCAGNPLIKQKMDLDIDVARLRLLKADHQSKQFRLEDDLLKNFPEQIKTNEGYIAGFKADMATLAQHPHPKEGFAGMVIRGDTLTEKDNAGAALLAARKEVKGLEPQEIGSYRGFTMFLSLEGFGTNYILTLKGQMSHRVELGNDAIGNLTRIDNALNGMETRLKSVEVNLSNIQKQMAEAKAELGKPFPYEAELQEKSDKLAALNAQLDLDTGASSRPRPMQTVAKSERPSILERLKQPLPEKTTNKQKSHTLEASL